MVAEGVVWQTSSSGLSRSLETGLGRGWTRNVPPARDLPGARLRLRGSNWCRAGGLMDQRHDGG